MKDQYVVSVIHVPGVTRERIQEYIREAIVAWAGQFRPSNPREVCPICAGKNEACKVCGGTGVIPSTQESDPLGPPCPLMKKGAVSVKKIPRGAKLFSANRNKPCY